MRALEGIKIVEIAGIGPGPVASMMLADLGAEVILIERKTINPNAAKLSQPNNAEFFKRGKQSIALDLKQPEAIELVLSLVAQADMFIEGFRPGVIERLGLGPEDCLACNKKLVYGRITGWGQYGPLAQSAGHDMNYTAISGILAYSGVAGDTPFPPATIIGDIGGGSLHLVMGMLAALIYSQRTGEGQVVDAAICDGNVYMQTLLASLYASGVVGNERGEEFFTGASHWANTYLCADGKYITVEALEPNFYQKFIALAGLSNDTDFSRQYDKALWPAAKGKLTAFFKTQPQSYWNEIFEGTDSCYAPVLSLKDAVHHPHNIARGNFVTNNDLIQPAPAPKLSKTPSKVGKIPAFGEHTNHILAKLKLSEKQYINLKKIGVI